MPLMDERKLQVLADNLGVHYYSDFRVLEFDDPELPGNEYAKWYFPTAEIYENGKWRLMVIGGRPYHGKHIAFNVIKGAEEAQKVFLEAMSNSGKRFSNCGLTNPIDNWGYELELI